jgi:hypothetical protein
MHNLSGYDVHLIIYQVSGPHKLTSSVPGSGAGNIKIIPQTDEKCITISTEVEVGKDDKGKPIKRELRFIDSFKFMPGSLDSSLANIKSYPNLGKSYQGEQLELLCKKGMYPYEYVDNVTVFDETELLPQDAFYSKLNECGITDKEYEHTCKVWKVFGCKTFHDYHEIYNRADVLQLADVFENCRDVCLKNYKLCSCWYYLFITWTCMGCMSKVN